MKSRSIHRLLAACLFGSLMCGCSLNISHSLNETARTLISGVSRTQTASKTPQDPPSTPVDTFPDPIRTEDDSSAKETVPPIEGLYERIVPGGRKDIFKVEQTADGFELSEYYAVNEITLQFGPAEFSFPGYNIPLSWTVSTDFGDRVIELCFLQNGTINVTSNIDDNSLAIYTECTDIRFDTMTYVWQ